MEQEKVLLNGRRNGSLLESWDDENQGINERK